MRYWTELLASSCLYCVCGGYSISLSLIVLNGFLNCIFLFVGGVAAYLGVIASERLTLLRLQKAGRAPLLIEGDHYIQRAVQGVRRARAAHSFPMLLITLLTVCLLVAELFAELGLNSSIECKPRRIQTRGLCPEVSSVDVSVLERSSVASIAQGLWNDEHLMSPIRQGFRTTFDGTEVFRVDEDVNADLPFVINGVTVSSVRANSIHYSHYTTSYVGQAYNMRMITALRVKDPNGGFDFREFGFGGETMNGNYSSGFMIQSATSAGSGPGDMVLYDFISKPSERVRQGIADTDIVSNATSEAADQLTKGKEKALDGPVLVSRVRIENASMNKQNVLAALVTFRFIQLQNPVKIHPTQTFEVLGTTKSFPEPMTAADIVRALISAKAVS